MLASCDQAELNLRQMHDALQALDMGCIEQITGELERMGEQLAEEGQVHWARAYLGETNRERSRFLEVKMAKDRVATVLEGYLAGSVSIKELV